MTFRARPMTSGVSWSIHRPRLRDSPSDLQESPPGLGEFTLGLGESRPGLREFALGLGESRPGLREFALGLRESRPGLGEFGLGLRESRPGLREFALRLGESRSGLEEPRRGQAMYGALQTIHCAHRRRAPALPRLSGASQSGADTLFRWRSNASPLIRIRYRSHAGAARLPKPAALIIRGSV
jgi:hypothetical protein